MKSLIAAGLLVAASGTDTLEPWAFFAQGNSEVTLLIVWGVVLLAAGRRVRVHLNAAHAIPSSSVAPARLHATGAQLGAHV